MKRYFNSIDITDPQKLSFEMIYWPCIYVAFTIFTWHVPKNFPEIAFFLRKEAKQKRNKSLLYSLEWVRSQHSTIKTTLCYFSLEQKKCSEDIPKRIHLCRFHENTVNFIISSGFFLYISIKYLKTWVWTIWLLRSENVSFYYDCYWNKFFEGVIKNLEEF